jgi:hypothetical protein
MKKRILYSLLAVMVVVPLTYFLGGLTVPKPTIQPTRHPTESESEQSAYTSSGMLHVAVDWKSPSAGALAEITMALEYGIRSIAVPWPEYNEIDDMGALLGSLSDEYPGVTWFFDVSLSPPTLWLEANSDSVLDMELGKAASVSSPKWLSYAKGKIDEVIQWEKKQENIKIGLIPTHLYQGNWYLNGDYDDSPLFRRVLNDRLERDDHAPLEMDAVLQEELDRSPTHLELYSELYNEKTIEAVLELVLHPRRDHQWAGEIFLPFGFNLNPTAMKNGHGAWTRLLSSNATGFVFPVRKDMSGWGKKGLFEGLPDLLRANQKNVIFLDQISTGVSDTSALRSNLSNEHWSRISHMLGRGIGTAWMNDAVYCISDSSGIGTYNAPEFWNEFSKNDLNVEAHPSAGRRDLLIITSKENGSPLLLKNFDEQFSHSGLQYTFHFLEDVLNDKLPPAHMYLYLDFGINSDAVFPILKTRVLSEGKALIHYTADMPGDVAAYEKITEAKIEFLKTDNDLEMPFSFAGEFVGENAQLEWLKEENTQVAFRSDDFDPLIKSIKEEHFNAGIHFDGQEGAYVLLTQPVTDPRFFLEIRALLELDAVKYSSKNNLEHFVSVKENSILLYGSGADKVTLSFPSPKTIKHVFDSTIGWVDTRSVEFDIEEGETVWLMVL